VKKYGHVRKKDTFLTSPRKANENFKKGGGSEWGIHPSEGRHFKNFLEGAAKSRSLLRNVDHVFALYE
jgi:hypothetical protein